MKKIAPGLYTFTGLVFGRVYLIVDQDGLTVIDTGLPFAPYVMARELRATGLVPGDIRRILITHAHPDHIGGLRTLRAMSGAEVIAPAIERPVIEGWMPIPRKPLRGLTHMQRLTRPPLVVLYGVTVDRAVREGDAIEEVLGGVRVLLTPGHTPGHVTYWQPARRIMFCGDVIAAGRGMRLPSPSWTVDMDENRRSIARLAELDARIVGFGHGRPLVKSTGRVMRAFARRNQVCPQNAGEP